MVIKLFSSSKTSLLFCFEDLEKKLKKELSDYDFLLFSIHPEFPIDDVNVLIKRVFKTKNYAAFHTINTFKNELILEKGVVLLAIKFEKRGKVKNFYIEDITNFKNDDSIDRCAKYLNENQDKFHIILASLSEEKFGYFIEELSNKIDYSPVNNIIGGISSGIKINEELRTYQFIDDKIIKKGFIILSFSNVRYKIDVSLGFKPYGITYKITRCEGNKLIKVDNRNFVEIAKGFLKDIKEPDIRYLWYLPINIIDERDGYVATMRTIEEIEENYVKFFGPLKNNQHFKVSFATADEILEEDKKCALKIKKEFKTPEVAFNFSCVARQYVLEDRQKEEVQIYTKILDTYIFGFFTFGEIGPDKMYKKLKLYNETSLLVAMEEI